MQIGPSDRHTGRPQKPRSSPAGAFCVGRMGGLGPHTGALHREVFTI